MFAVTQELTAAADALRQRLSDSHATHDELRSQVAAAEETAAELSAELGTAKDHLQAPCSACERLRAAAAATQGTVATLQARVAELEASVADLTAARDAAAASLRREREDRHSAMADTVHALRQEVAHLQAQLTKQAASPGNDDLTKMLEELVGTGDDGPAAPSTWVRGASIRNVM